MHDDRLHEAWREMTTPRVERLPVDAHALRRAAARRARRTLRREGIRTVLVATAAALASYFFQDRQPADTPIVQIGVLCVLAFVGASAAAWLSWRSLSQPSGDAPLVVALTDEATMAERNMVRWRYAFWLVAVGVLATGFLSWGRVPASWRLSARLVAFASPMLVLARLTLAELQRVALDRRAWIQELVEQAREA